MKIFFVIVLLGGLMAGSLIAIEKQLSFAMKDTIFRPDPVAVARARQIICDVDDWLHQPKDKIVIKSVRCEDELECTYTKKMVRKHKRPLESITQFVFCSDESRVTMIPNFRTDIKVSLITWINDESFWEVYLSAGHVGKLDEALYIVPPQFAQKQTTCVIEHPLGKKFELTTMALESFMKQVEGRTSFDTPDDGRSSSSGEE